MIQANPRRVIVDSEEYSAGPLMFASVAEAQATLRAASPEFYRVTLRLIGTQVINEHSQVAGYRTR